MPLKFVAKVKGLLEGIEPAVTVASKGTEREYEYAGLITLVADDKGISVLADGGRVSLATELLADLHDIGYQYTDGGTATVNAVALKTTLSSFDLSDELLIEEKNVAKIADGGGGREIVLTALSDKDRETFQTLPVAGRDISKSSVVKPVTESKKVKIRRDILVGAAKRLIFAHGYELYKQEFMHWKIDLSSDKVRFAAGTGSLFAILDLEGKDIAETKSEASILVPNLATAPVIEALSTQKDEFAAIIPSDRYLTIRCGHIHILIANLEPSVKWPDINRFLNRDSAIRITTKLDNWQNAVRGLAATYSDDLKQANEFHIAQLQFDSSKRQIFATTNGVMKSQRKVSVEDSQFDGVDKCEIQMMSVYLNMCVKEAKDDEYVQIEIDPSSNKAPIIFRYHAKQTVDSPTSLIKVSDGSGIAERYSVFFAQKMQKN